MLEPTDHEVTCRIRHYWDARAATFDREPGHGLHSQDQRQAWLHVLARLTDGTPRRVLDVGCGTGFLALLLAGLGHTVTGIDLAPQMLNFARQKALRAELAVQFRLENAMSLSDPNGCYDLVVARHVIWTLPDPARAVGEWLRVLRKGGRLALIEGKWSSPDETSAEYSASSKMTPAAVMRKALRTISNGVGRKQWAFFLGVLNSWRYRQVETRLPFFGGPPVERLIAFLVAQGLRDVTSEPLMHPVLWGEVPRHPRYLVIGSR